MILSMDWFKGNFTGKPYIQWENLWFPVDFPVKTNPLILASNMWDCDGKKRYCFIINNGIHLCRKFYPRMDCYFNEKLLIDYYSMDWFCWENLQETIDFLVKYRAFL